ncbi:MAG: beta-phosphoglucomutase [Bacteroidales bacterium]|nr:beta-phosphoglucomutase [Bacteroidales bacterium]
MIKAVIFDLDGVIVTTDEFHYQGWQKLANEEGIFFNRTINERLRGVSRFESLEIILEKATRTYSHEEKAEMAERKNNYYRALLHTLTPADILPGVLKLLTGLRNAGIKVAVGSSSRNTPFILEKIGLSRSFDTVSDGNQIKKSKPDPEVFLLAAAKMQVPADQCLVVEDADAGVEAANRAGMKCLAVGSARSNPLANMNANSLNEVSVDQLLNL